MNMKDFRKLEKEYQIREAEYMRLIREMADELDKQYSAIINEMIRSCIPRGYDHYQLYYQIDLNQASCFPNMLKSEEIFDQFSNEVFYKLRFETYGDIEIVNDKISFSTSYVRGLERATISIWVVGVNNEQTSIEYHGDMAAL